MSLCHTTTLPADLVDSTDDHGSELVPNSASYHEHAFFVHIDAVAEVVIEAAQSLTGPRSPCGQTDGSIVVPVNGVRPYMWVTWRGNTGRVRVGVEQSDDIAVAAR